MKFLIKIPSLIAIGIITFYRGIISPLFPSCCRFEPTCSTYGLQAFKEFGFIKGFLLTFKRILKCRPGGPYGYNPVPEKPVKSNINQLEINNYTEEDLNVGRI